jgi:hypothetical protein
MDNFTPSRNKKLFFSLEHQDWCWGLPSLIEWAPRALLPLANGPPLHFTPSLHAFIACPERTVPLPHEHQRDLSSIFHNVQGWKNIKSTQKMTLSKLPHCTCKAIKIDDSTNGKKGNFFIWYLTFYDISGGQLGTIMKITINICRAARKV